MKYFVGYTCALMVLLVVDLIWLGVIAKPMYSKGIGHLMAEQPNLWAASVFYLIYTFGLMYFSIAPPSGDTAWPASLLAAATFGFVAYSTYDLSNLATLKGWPVHLVFVDIAWGSLVSTVAAAAGKVSFHWAAAYWA